MNKFQREIETAFGRPASWWAALPAVVVGCGAFLIAVYGTWWMPARLLPHYKYALQQASQDYQKLASSQSSSITWRIGERAGELDVIFSRLIGLERADANRYWEWAEFLQNHVRTIQLKLQNPAVTIQPDVRERLIEQATQFESKSREIFDQLAQGKSKLRTKSILRVAQWKYQRGLGEYGVRDVDKLVAMLRDTLEELSLNNKTHSVNGEIAPANDNASQVDEARLLLLQLLIEGAWQDANGSRLVANESQLQQAWDLLKQYRPASGNAAADVQWQSLEHLLAAMTGREVPDAVLPAARTRNLTTTEDPWRLELAELHLSAVAGDWKDISFRLTRQTVDRPAAVSSALARTICRLACSPLARQPNKWAEQAELGVLLAAQLAPHIPEFSELLWQCAEMQTSSNTSPLSLSPIIPETIARGQNAPLKHTVSAMSATLSGQPSIARTHLELISRSRVSLALVARTVLWRAQILAPEVKEPNASAIATLKPEQRQELSNLIELMTSATRLEPESGLNWFTLGTLQYRAGELQAMRDSLKRAEHLLGAVPAIEQMLQSGEK